MSDVLLTARVVFCLQEKSPEAEEPSQHVLPPGWQRCEGECGELRGFSRFGLHSRSVGWVYVCVCKCVCVWKMVCVCVCEGVGVYVGRGLVCVCVCVCVCVLGGGWHVHVMLTSTRAGCTTRAVSSQPQS